MAETIAPDEQTNYETFRDCLGDPVLRSLAAPIERPKKKKKSARKSLKISVEVDNDAQKESTRQVETTNDAEDLGEFIDVATPFPGNA